MITSTHNEKLKLIRKLHERKHREREGLFVAEGEDLVAAAARAGVEPEVVLVAGEDVEPRLLDAVSTLGSGTRAIGVYRQRWSEPVGPVCVYLHEVGDPGNVGAVVRTAHALVEGAVALGPGCADPYSPKAVRATMGSIFAQPVARAELDETPAPRVGLSAHGGSALDRLAAPADTVLRIGARRTPGRRSRPVRRGGHDPAARRRARVAQCRRGGCDRVTRHQCAIFVNEIGGGLGVRERTWR